MKVNESLTEILDKAWEDKALSDIVKQSPEVLQGISEKKAQALKEALGVKTIAELATNKYVLWAQALNNLSGYEK
ncbi:MAG: hypothetical protein HQL72_11130 [Magnetococcales bacterium]|nr:hypothetical protein [Magnetococcales bacterium]